MEAFALTGRNYHLYIIPRVLPWARSFCPFRAYGAIRAYGASFFLSGVNRLTVNSCFLYGQPSDFYQGLTG